MWLHVWTTQYLAFLYFPSKQVLPSIWCDPLNLSLQAAKQSPGFPQLPSCLTALYPFPPFSSTPLHPNSPPHKHQCMTFALFLCHSVWVPLGFWHSQINVNEILLWLKSISSQRLPFFLSWLWGFASGTTYTDAVLSLAGLLLMSSIVSGYEVAHALLNYLAW